tara:strand:+ start:513 stop:722 length:210 start_codon:yes stop_codon:yes gene_type:complete
MSILRNRSTKELVHDLWELKAKLSELNCFILEHEYVIREKLIAMAESEETPRAIHCLKLDPTQLRKYFK